MAIKINSDQVVSIANDLERLNKKLTEQLEESKNIIQSLASYWEGEAYQSVLDSYSSFATKYFQNYEETIQSYITFLRKNVAEGYVETEKVNTSLSDAFK